MHLFPAALFLCAASLVLSDEVNGNSVNGADADTSPEHHLDNLGFGADPAKPTPRESLPFFGSSDSGNNEATSVYDGAPLRNFDDEEAQSSSKAGTATQAYGPGRVNTRVVTKVKQVTTVRRGAKGNRAVRARRVRAIRARKTRITRRRRVVRARRTRVVRRRRVVRARTRIIQNRRTRIIRNRTRRIVNGRTRVVYGPDNDNTNININIDQNQKDSGKDYVDPDVGKTPADNGGGDDYSEHDKTEKHTDTYAGKKPADPDVGKQYS